MNTTRPIAIRLFGAFRQGQAGSTLTVDIPPDARVAELRQAMHAALASDSARALLQASAFATDTEVLDDDQLVPEREISILPPVCGG
jgi:molybdopterin converting factor small subunit